MTRLGRRIVWLSLSALLVLAPAVSAFDTPPPGVIDDAWYSLYMHEAKCGHMHSVTTRIGDAVESRLVMNVELSRGPADVRMTFEQNYRESLDGRPLSFRHVMRMGETPMIQRGTIQGDKVELVTEQFGGKHKATYAFDPEVRFPWGQLLEQKRRGLKPGTSFTVKSYEPTVKVDQAVPMTIEVIGREPVKVLGKTRRLHRVKMTMDLAQPLVSDAWVDDDYSPIVTTVNLGFLTIKMYRTTLEEATRAAKAPELFFSTMVKTDRVVPEKAERVTLRLRIPESAAQDMKMPDLPETSMQTVRRVGDREAVVTIRRLDWNKINAVRDGAPPGKLAEYLKASPLLDIGDEKVAALAQRAVKGDPPPGEKADLLRRFVTRYVRDKSLDVSFATASEVARTRRGDCSEHGVLLAALARARGLPARGVSGIVQVPAGEGDKGGLFGYHMWTQVNIGGQWVDIDAAMRQTDCDPTHVALSIMPLNDEAGVDWVLSLLPLLGRLQIDVVKIE